MNQTNFAIFHNLRIGDRLIRNKGLFVKHHGIYVGLRYGVPSVAENQPGNGVQYVTLSEFLLNDPVNLVRIEYFNEIEQDRNEVIPFIDSLLGKPYNLANFNCEHFAELVQTGAPASKQVGAVVLGVAAIAIYALTKGGRKKAMKKRTHIARRKQVRRKNTYKK